MTVERLKCIECGALILPRTAEKYGGMCAHCGDMPEWLRVESREYQHRLATGAVFVPTDEERKSGKIPQEFGAADTVWNLEPDYYSDIESDTVDDVIAAASQETKGDVFLISTVDSRFNLSFTERFGVCEYQNQTAGDFLYAYTPQNLREQVSEDQHVIQACPCCGVGMLWFPSRFHMPRKLAFGILSSVVSKTLPADIEWLNTGDFSYTSPGSG